MFISLLASYITLFGSIHGNTLGWILPNILILKYPFFYFRSNKRYFEAFQLVPLIQEHLRHHDSDNAFLSLNLRSVLVNISGVQSA